MCPQCSFYKLIQTMRVTGALPEKPPKMGNRYAAVLAELQCTKQYFPREQWESCFHRIAQEYKLEVLCPGTR